MTPLARILTATLVLGSLAPAAPAAAATETIRMIDYAYKPGTLGGLTTNPKDPARDHRIVWRNDGDDLHDVVEIASQNGIRVRATALSSGQTSGGLRLKNAATYRYVCTYHPDMKGAIKIRPALYKPGSPGNYAITQGPAGKAIVRLGQERLPDAWVMDVQRRRGAGNWQTIKSGIRARSLKVSPNAEGGYRFRARIRHTGKGTKTAWSPPTLKLTIR